MLELVENICCVIAIIIWISDYNKIEQLDICSLKTLSKSAIICLIILLFVLILL